MRKLRLLDLFCGAGGSARGYQLAGFHVTGVDIHPQPRYAGDYFIQADALSILRGMLCYPSFNGEMWRPGYFQAIHASPPCQAFSVLTRMHDVAHEDLLTPTRALLAAMNVPWVIENVPGAPMRPDLVLCGDAFGLKVRRHRWFETDPRLYVLTSPCVHDGPPVGVYGHPGGRSERDARRSTICSRRGLLADWKSAMGIDWMTAAELSQAIPPAYTQFIGEQLLTHVGAVHI